MTVMRSHRWWWGGVLIGGALLFYVSTLAQHDDSIAIVAKLLGSWRLVSWEEHDSSGRISYPLGARAIGQIMYTSDGRMSAQLMRPDSPRFVSEDWRQATRDEKSTAWGDYFGYFGTFSIDHDKRAVVHHIEGSWFPNLLGTDQRRYFRFEGERLILDADTEWGKVHIVWEKVRGEPMR
jgi:hypothetical protein